MTKTTQTIAVRFIAMILFGFGVLGLSNQALAQNEVATLDFEADGNGADWNWGTFENTAANPPLEFITNPDASGINTSAMVAKFTALADGAPWAGTRGTGGSTFLFDEANRTISIMVWKSVISDVGIKLETASNWSQGEIKVANTKVNEWEEIVIDFSGRENPPNGEEFNGISVFPDFKDGRGQENVVYFDNIAFEGFVTSGDDDNGDNGDGEDVATLDFEEDGNGADWNWATFENTAANPPLEFIANPDASGINTSAMVAKFTALADGAPWAGTRGTGGSTFLFDEANRTISIMVWKSVISDVGIKLETASNWSQGEIKVANTKVNEWEEIVIDFTGRENPPNGEEFNGISVFPDFKDGRGQENVVYFDNIAFEGFVTSGDDDNGDNGDGEDVAPLDFEADGNGADWNWATFENAANPPLEFIANPDASGINTSAMVAKFTALADGAPWAGTRGTGGSKFLFDEANRTISIMVWKSVISDVGIKLETASNWSQGEIKVANTKVNEWEEIVIDFTGRENPPDGEPFNGISVFPDFQDGRGQENVVYFDNIAFEGFVTSGDDDNGEEDDAPETAAPAPTHHADHVISVFSDTYTDIDDINLNPGWGQSTQVSFVEIEGSNTMKYANFNFQGTEIAPSIDASEMTHLHIDMWTADATTVDFTIISPGPQEKLYAMDITPNEWVGYDIPLTYFDNVNLADIFQLKFDGGNGSQTIYLDNIFFYDANPTNIDEVDDRPTRFALAQNYPNPFNPSTQIEYALPETAHVRLDVYDMIGQRVATLVNENVNAGNHTVSFDASALSSGMYLYRLQAGSTVLTKKMTLIK